MISTLGAPSKRNDAVNDKMTWPKRRFKFVYVGRSMSKLRRQISDKASLSIILVKYVCPYKECTQSTLLYGSTTSVATRGQDQTVKLIFDFLP